MSLKQEQKKCNCKNPIKDVADITIKIKERIRARKKELTMQTSQYCIDCTLCQGTSPTGSWFVCNEDTCSSPCTCRSSPGDCQGFYTPCP